MPRITISSRDLNQGFFREKSNSGRGPVFISDRGELSHVLLTMEEYRKMKNKEKNIMERLAMPGIADIDVEFPRSKDLPGDVNLD